MRRFNNWVVGIFLLTLGLSSCEKDNDFIPACPKLSYQRIASILRASSNQDIDLSLYWWTVDRERDDVNFVNGQFILDNLEKGSHEICIHVSSPQCNTKETKYCETIVIE